MCNSGAVVWYTLESVFVQQLCDVRSVKCSCLWLCVHKLCQRRGGGMMLRRTSLPLPLPLPLPFALTGIESSLIVCIGGVFCKPERARVRARATNQTRGIGSIRGRTPAVCWSMVGWLVGLVWLVSLYGVGRSQCKYLSSNRWRTKFKDLLAARVTIYVWGGQDC